MEITAEGGQPASQGRLLHLLRGLGPGILLAAAAIGGSHLVASTRAGAEFGWQLGGLILLVNLLKYPFFLVGTRYTLATGESLQYGYLRMGRAYLAGFTLLNLIAAVVNTAGVALLTAAILSLFVPGVPLTWLSAIVLGGCLLLLVIGHYHWLDRITKVVMLALTTSTLIAVTIAFHRGAVAPADFVSPDPWQLAYIGGLVALMGWMPCPIELSSWTSLWLLSKQQQQGVSKAQALFDFNVGYITTALLALVFMALGALIMHGSEEQLAGGGAAFSAQLVNMYAAVIGDWSRWLIAFIALCCLFSTTITVIDGYSRTLAEGSGLLSGHPHPQARNRHQWWMLLQSLAGLSVVLFFKGALMAMLEFAMVLAFITTAIFAWLNYRLMESPQVPASERMGWPMKLLSWAGLAYLFGFVGLFGYWYLWIK